MAKEIVTLTRTLREIAREPLELGPYQRDYEWGLSETNALFSDLKEAFLARNDSDAPKQYFLGPIVTKASANNSQRDEVRLVDGQQRLTTLTLLAVAIRRVAKGDIETKSLEISGDIDEADIDPEAKAATPVRLSDPWLKAPKFADANQPQILADKSRGAAFQTLENEGVLATPTGDGERNLARNFAQLSNLLVGELDRDDLAAFMTWLADSVVFAEVRVSGAQSDFVVFDAMNSRGKPLEPLSRFIATFSASITPTALQEQAQAQFQSIRLDLAKLGEREDVEFVKSWAMARCISFKPHAPPADGKTARNRKAETQIPEIIRESIQFVQKRAEHHGALGLSDPRHFVETHWRPYSEIYLRVRNAYRKHDSDLDSLWFLAKTRFEGLTEHFDEALFLAACPPGTQRRTARLLLVAKFLEIIAARDSWCRLTDRPIKKDQRNKDRLQYFLAKAAADIRGKEIGDQAQALKAILYELRFGFDDVPDPIWKGGDAKHVRMVLAGLTTYLEELAGRPALLVQFSGTRGGAALDIEHLLPKNMTPRAGHNFRQRGYDEHRNRLCCLVLIPSSENRSLSDLPYDKKIAAYGAQPFNTLVKTLFGTERQDMQLRAELNNRELEFPLIESWNAELAKTRQKILLRVANLAWSPDRLDEIAAADQSA
jgi:hypothetical protein